MDERLGMIAAAGHDGSITDRHGMDNRVHTQADESQGSCARTAKAGVWERKCLLVAWLNFRIHLRT